MLAALIWNTNCTKKSHAKKPGDFNPYALEEARQKVERRPIEELIRKLAQEQK